MLKTFEWLPMPEGITEFGPGNPYDLISYHSALVDAAPDKMSSPTVPVSLCWLFSLARMICPQIAV